MQAKGAAAAASNIYSAGLDCDPEIPMGPSAAPQVIGRYCIYGKIASGQFPRELAVEADGNTLLASNYASKQLEAVDVTGLG